MAPIAQALVDRGAEVAFAVRELGRAAPFLAPLGLPIHQAPLALGAPGDVSRFADSFADILRWSGWIPDILPTLLRAWESLLQQVRPDVLVLDHAPTALLAAWFADLPAIAIGTGFTVPARGEPMPTLQPWEDVSRERLARAEDVVNEALRACAPGRLREPPSTISRLLGHATRFLTTFPELDHYGPRPDGRYIGEINTVDAGAPAVWPDLPGPKIFAYLAGDHRRMAQVLQALEDLGAPVLLHARDLDRGMLARRGSSVIRLEPRPVRMADALAQADLVACHGGHGVACAALRSGVPLALFPSQLEQALLAYRLTRQGAAASPKGGGDSGRELAVLAAVAHEPRYRAAAAAVAARNRHVDRAGGLRAVVHAALAL